MRGQTVKTFIIRYASGKGDLVFKNKQEFFEAISFHIQYDAWTIDTVACPDGKILVVTVS